MGRANRTGSRYLNRCRVHSCHLQTDGYGILWIMCKEEYGRFAGHFVAGLSLRPAPMSPAPGSACRAVLALGVQTQAMPLGSDQRNSIGSYRALGSVLIIAFNSPRPGLNGGHPSLQNLSGTWNGGQSSGAPGFSPYPVIC